MPEYYNDYKLKKQSDIPYEKCGEYRTLFILDI